MEDDEDATPIGTPLSEIFGEPNLGQVTSRLINRFSELYRGIESIDGFQKLPKRTQRALEAAPNFVEMSARRIADEDSTQNDRMEAAEDLMIAALVVAPYVSAPASVMNKVLDDCAAHARLHKLSKDESDSKALRSAILDVTKGCELRGTASFAESILDEVRRNDSVRRVVEEKRRRGRSEGWPSRRTIQRRICAILEERRRT